MKDAIKKAIEGGYETRDARMLIGDELPPEVLIDPLFWKALGKALGDGKSRVIKSGGEPVDSISINFVPGSDGNFHAIERWKFRWHRLIDHLASGGDIEEFFKKLIK